MWTLPNKEILNSNLDLDQSEEMEQALKAGDVITERLDELGMRCEVDDIDIGPQVIRYSMIAAEKVQIRLLGRYSAELQYELGSESVRILAPIPGEKYVGIEIANPKRRTIDIGNVITAAKSPLEVPLGISPNNQVITADIRRMPHCLVAGQTGGGKSVGLHNMICSLLMSTTPDQLLFHMTDTKQVELTVYDDIPNLVLPVVTDPYDAIINFKALVTIMEHRYELAKEYNAKTLEELNARLPPENREPYILIVVDEIADLMFLSRKEVEESIVRIAAKSRAVGMHMILATQSPRREVITGLLKCNLPSRLAFSTTSGLDSRIVGVNGAEGLLGCGDALFSDQGRSPQRIQTPYISSDEIDSIVSHWSNQTNTEVAA